MNLHWTWSLQWCRTIARLCLKKTSTRGMVITVDISASSWCRKS